MPINVNNVELIDKLFKIAVEKGYELPKCMIVKTENRLYSCTIEFMTHRIETEAATEDLALYLCASNMSILCECPTELKPSKAIIQIGETSNVGGTTKPMGIVENDFKPSRKLDAVSYLNGFARKTKRKLPEYLDGKVLYQKFSVICRFMELTTEGSSENKKIAKKNAAFEMLKMIRLDISMVIDYSGKV